MNGSAVGNPWLVPAVIVAATGVFVQGVKAGWDLIMSIRGYRNSAKALRLQEMGALINLVSALPLAEARKAVWKVKLVSLIREEAAMKDIYRTLEEVMADVSRGQA